jgi:hypothetical protein
MQFTPYQQRTSGMGRFGEFTTSGQARERPAAF